MYITFGFYQANGGVITDEVAFTLLEKKARYKLDYCTQNRIHTLEPIPEPVQDCMVELVNSLGEQLKGEKITSFSNDGVSVSFDTTDEEKAMYNLIIQMLPSELTYRGVR